MIEGQSGTAGLGHVGEAILTLLAFVLFAILFERARLGSIVGLLVAGVVIGPNGLGIVTQVYMIDVLAELGVDRHLWAHVQRRTG